MVAQESLELFVMVRIHAGQPVSLFPGNSTQFRVHSSGNILFEATKALLNAFHPLPVTIFLRQFVSGLQQNAVDQKCDIRYSTCVW